MRAHIPDAPSTRAQLFRRSGNKKLGGIPASITARGSCPTTCSLYERGCYAEYHVLAVHWRRVGAKGDDWADFCEDVRQLPEDALWRHNMAGDLPGDSETIDVQALEELVRANDGKRGFTFTHKPTLSGASVGVLVQNAAAIARANREGFTVNLSANSLEEADELADVNERGAWIGPIVVVLPSDAPARGNRTPAGRRIAVCPAETHELTCAECRLCAHPTRQSIVGFRAHGQAHALISDLVRGRRPAA